MLHRFHGKSLFELAITGESWLAPRTEGRICSSRVGRLRRCTLSILLKAVLKFGRGGILNIHIY